MKLYKEHGVNPAAGCLPLLVQLPIFWGLYTVLQQVVAGNPTQVLSSVNTVLYTQALALKAPWNPNFFGIPLGQSPAHLMGVIGPLILLAPFLTAFSQFLSTKMMMAVKQKNNAIVEKKDKQASDDFAQAFQTQSMYIFPLMIGFFSFQLPFGMTLYWITFTVFGILQQYRVSGLGGLKPWVESLKKKLWMKK